MELKRWLKELVKVEDSDLAALETVLCGAHPGGFAAYLEELEAEQGASQCNVVWTYGAIAYRCRDCQINDARQRHRHQEHSADTPKPLPGNLGQVTETAVAAVVAQLVLQVGKAVKSPLQPPRDLLKLIAWLDKISHAAGIRDIVCACMAAPLPPNVLAAVGQMGVLGSTGNTGNTGSVGSIGSIGSVGSLGNAGTGRGILGGSGEGSAGEGRLEADARLGGGTEGAGGGAGEGGEPAAPTEATAATAAASLFLPPLPSPSTPSAVQFLLETLAAMTEEVVTQEATLFLLLLYSPAFKNVFSALLIRQYPLLVLSVLPDHNPSACFIKIEKALDRGEC
ncbi:unnamed protein product [Closterium sp. NIES-53]